MSDKITLEGLAQEQAALRAENEKKNAQLSKLLEELAVLRAENEKKNAQLSKLLEELAVLREANDGLTSQLQQQTLETQAVVNANAQLKNKLEGFIHGSVTIDPKRERAKMPADPTFTVAGKKYKLLAPAANLPGIGFRKADEILMDKELLAKLVEMKSGIIKEVV